MAFLEIQNVKLSGLSACVPKTILENKDYIGFASSEEAEKFMTTTGVYRKRISAADTCTSDLCLHAAEKLIADLKWDKKDIDCLIFVSQTHDYILPATSCLLQNRLGLKEEIFALDISLGCSGWVYGLQVLASLLSHGHFKKGLLLVGDTVLKPCSVEDKSTYPLFGDAGTASALEFSPNSVGFKFQNSTDGKGFEAIIIPNGGYRNGVSPFSFEVAEIEPGIKRTKLHILLDGMNVFSFGISKAPESVNNLSQHFSIDLQGVDFFVFHQANLFMNEKIRKKLKLPKKKCRIR